jgi:hypothetical protein
MIFFKLFFIKFLERKTFRIIKIKRIIIQRRKLVKENVIITMKEKSLYQLFIFIIYLSIFVIKTKL